ncbi:MAG TPA: hypothetical protein VEU33_28345 [Archangium sp.]|nr:hypothetical protein [Archangium sp.]
MSSVAMYRAVLDTCVVREQFGSTPGAQKLDLQLIRQNRNTITLSLADLTLVEILEDLLDGSLPWNEWRPGIRSLQPLLDYELPVLPGGRELSILAGLFGDETLSFETRRFQRGLLKMLMRAESLGRLHRTLGARGEEGDDSESTLARSQRILQEARDKWVATVERIRDLARNNTPNTSQEQLIGSIILGLEARDGEALNLPEKLESMAANLGRVIHSAMQQNGYKPSSKKRRNDGLDFTLLQALTLDNTVLVTRDGGLVSNLKAAKSSSAKRILTADELNNHLRQGTLESVFV